MIDLEATTVPWIDPERRKPLYDVPWLGTSVVLSDGKVNFCCYTSAVAGNVNELTFDEIWNGPVMRNIRSELAQNRFPVECKTDSCPIFRGDTLNYLRVRMDGEESLVLCGRKELAGTELTASRTPERRVSIAIETQNSAGVRAVDLFVAIKRPNGTLYFLPEGDELPIPCAVSASIPEDNQRLVIGEWPLEEEALADEGNEVWAAFLFPESNPNVPANVLWADRVVV